MDESKAGICYNHINGCTNPYGGDPKFHAFCSEACWRQYNNVQDAKPKSHKNLNEWIKDFKSRK